MKVSESNRPTSESSARRIAIFAVEQMLRDGEIEGDDINVRLANAAFIERAFFELALRDKLSCDELEEEIRIKEDFPHTYRDKFDGGKAKTATCQPSYALGLSLEPGTYSDKCINAHMKELYQAAREKLLEDTENESRPKSSRKRRYDRTRRVRAARNQGDGA